MTWAEFKTAVEALGVTDDDEIKYIDVAYLSELTLTRSDDDQAVSILD